MMAGLRLTVVSVLLWAATQTPVLATLTDTVQGQPLTEYSALTGFDGITFRFAMQQEHPFVFYDSAKTGEDRFSGITVEIIKKLASADVLNFQQAHHGDIAANLPCSNPTAHVSIAAADGFHACVCRRMQQTQSPPMLPWKLLAWVSAVIGQEPGSEHWADVAAGAIHVTADRATKVHFTIPFFET
eukprot:2077475-Rhodomonas_salina.1